MEIKLLEEKDKNWTLLLDSWYEFHWFCPPGSAIKAFQTAEGKDYLRRLLHAFVQNIDSPIVIAWDSIREQVAGFCVNLQVYKDTVSEVNEMFDRTHQVINNSQLSVDAKEEIAMEQEFWPEIENKLDMFGRLNHRSYWQILFLSVKSEYGKQGIGKKLVEFSVKQAQKAGHQVVMANFGSSYSAKIGYDCGFEPEIETRYADKYKLYEKIDDSLKEKHPVCITMLKNI